MKVSTLTMDCRNCGFPVPVCGRCAVCGTHFAKLEYLDKLTSALTAMDTWNELIASMERGYCPTIHDRGRRYRRLIAAVRAAGFKVFNNGRVS